MLEDGRVVVELGRMAQDGGRQLVVEEDMMVWAGTLQLVPPLWAQV